MSFDALKSSDITRKIKDIEIKVGENTLKFQAKEISYLQRMHIAHAQKSGGDPFVQLLVYSIVDEAGKHMSPEQAAQLSDIHALQFFTAASEVNGYMAQPADAKEEGDSQKN